jgi:Ankyrin repeats (3 copies)
MTFARAIAQRDRTRVSGLLAAAPELASTRFGVGATRQAAGEYFLAEIDHSVCCGDTALHIAAAAYEAHVVRELVNAGAIATAANRRGAEPLHYAVDGIPGSARWNPASQQHTVQCLVELGAAVEVLVSR